MRNIDIINRDEGLDELAIARNEIVTLSEENAKLRNENAEMRERNHLMAQDDKAAKIDELWKRNEYNQSQRITLRAENSLLNDIVTAQERRLRKVRKALDVESNAEIDGAIHALKREQHNRASRLPTEFD